jgi:hypothetical protein
MGKTIDRTVDVPSGYAVVTTYRLVETDNFGRDYPDESFVAVGIESKDLAEGFAKALNDKRGLNAQRHIHVVEHTEIVYCLQPGFRP